MSSTHESSDLEEQARAVSPNRLVPRDRGSLAALRELGDFAIASPEIAERIHRFLEIGAPIFRCEVDRAATESTGDLVTIYEPSDRLNAFLSALRAGRELVAT